MPERCSVCLEDKIGRPLAACIPCGHTYCVVCLKQLTSSGESPCPECRAPIHSTQKIYLSSSPPTLAQQSRAVRSHKYFEFTKCACMLAILVLLIWHDYKAPDGFTHVFLQPFASSVGRGVRFIFSPVYNAAAHIISLATATRLFGWVASVVLYVTAIVTTSVCFVYDWIAFAVMFVVSVMTTSASWLFGWIAFVVTCIVSAVTTSACWLYGWIAFVVVWIMSMIGTLAVWLYGWVAFVGTTIAAAFATSGYWLYGWIAYVVTFIVSMVISAISWLLGWLLSPVTYMASPVTSAANKLFSSLKGRACEQMCPCGGEPKMPGN